MRIDDFIKNKTALGRTDGTIECIKTHLQCFWNFYKSKQKKLKTINKKDIEGYLFYLRQKSYKPSTIRNRINMLRHFLQYRNIKTFPTFKISQPKRLPKFLDFNDLKKLRQTIKKERDLLILDLLYATGMRVAELCSLDCEHINGHSLLITGKGDKERIVEMPEELYLRLKMFASRNRYDPVFLSKDKRISRFAVNSLIKRYGERAQLNIRVSPHKIRHSFATHFLNNGGRIEAVSTLLGHSNIATTQIYARLSNQKVREEYMKFYEKIAVANMSI